jgi:alpha-galactosidase
MPKLREIARQGKQAARLEDAPEPYRYNRLSWQLFDLFGAFPAVLDTHVCEFFPNMFCGKDGFFGRTLGVDVFRFEDVIAQGDAKFARMTDAALSDKPLPPSYFGVSEGEHEQVIDIIQSIRGDDGAVYFVNLPDGGWLPGLPPESILEAPAMAAASGMKPIAQRPLSPGLPALWRRACGGRKRWSTPL